MYNEKEMTKAVIQSENVADLIFKYGLNYIIPKKSVIGEANTRKHSEAAVFIHLFYDDFAETCFSYITEIVNICDVYITTSKSVIKNYIEKQCSLLRIKNCNIKLVDNRGYDIASLLVHQKDDILRYKYFCFTHDKKSGHIKDVEISKLWCHSLWENTVSSAYLISNILMLFKKNDLLGVLSVPLPFLPEWYSDENNFWYSNYDDTVKLAKKLGLNCELSANKLCVSVGTAFWARTEAVSLLLKKEFTLNDFPESGVSGISYAIERIFPYVAQHNGFYTGTVISDEFEVFRSNYLYSHNRQMYSFYRKLLPLNDYIDFSKWTNFLHAYQATKNKYSKFYVYGAGKISEKFINTFLLEKKECDSLKFDAIVVSDGHRTSSSFMEIPVFEFSEIQNKKDSFFIVAIAEEQAKSVLELLDEKKLPYYLI